MIRNVTTGHNYFVKVNEAPVATKVGVPDKNIDIVMITCLAPSHYCCS